MLGGQSYIEVLKWSRKLNVGGASPLEAAEGSMDWDMKIKVLKRVWLTAGFLFEGCF